MEQKTMVNKGLFTSNTNEWTTPRSFYEELNKEFNFTLDPCATDSNHKCNKYYTIKENGLLQDWSGETVFCNPPYGRAISEWVKKCYNEHIDHGVTVVMLIPARTDTKYFHDYIYNKTEIRFIKGRLKFNDGKQGAPFPSMLVIYKMKGDAEK